MSKLIDRYVRAVTMRLPEKERDDVGNELKANIYDTLPENPSDIQIEKVLNDLGAPNLLASKYSQESNSLISSVYYYDYLKTLERVLPWVGIVLFIIGAVIGSLGSETNGGVGGINDAISVITSGFVYAFSAMIQTLVVVTVGFVIIDKLNDSNKDNYKIKPWSVKDLPEIKEVSKYSFSLADSISEIALTVIFFVAVVFIYIGKIPFGISVFSQSFMQKAMPLIAMHVVLKILENAAEIKFRKWTISVCVMHIITTIAGSAVFIYLLRLPSIFSDEFFTFAQSREWGNFDILRLIKNNSLQGTINILMIIVVVFTIIECLVSIYKTYMTAKEAKQS